MTRVLAAELVVLSIGLALPRALLLIVVVGAILAGYFADRPEWDREDHRSLARRLSALNAVVIGAVWFLFVPLEGDLADTTLLQRLGLAILLGAGGGLGLAGLILIGLDARSHFRN